ncbi:MAG: transglutaminase-like cysteine peptidase [Geminicoccaceae bacterium]|nr:transglutaminase-like cysteine peptidase [Geminicoccaceae bacterium]
MLKSEAHSFDEEKHMRFFAFVVGLILFCGGGAARAGAPVALFGTAEFRADSHEALPQWRRVLHEIAAEASGYDRCAHDYRSCANRSTMSWMSLLKSVDGLSPLEQARRINAFANRSPYRTDSETYARSDYWATPSEFLKNSGDCEDYAIFKYVSLRLVGFKPDDLRIVVLNDTLRGLAHAVLAVYLADGAYILDNVTNAVLPQGRISQYVPYYSINETARWAHVPPSQLMMTATSAGERTWK